MALLLHCCCAPCATACIERLTREGVEFALFYDNPNIYPEKERQKRLDWLKALSKIHSLPLIAQHTPHERWLEAVRGLEGEKEGGERCKKCFEFNLSLVQKYILSHPQTYDSFATSLTVSRFKNSSVIFESAKNFPEFAAYDFKKNAGFERSCVLSSQLGLYRQKYCGCEFSLSS